MNRYKLIKNELGEGIFDRKENKQIKYWPDKTTARHIVGVMNAGEYFRNQMKSL